jgi:uncharacterized damage-inducible protein DinB
MNQEILQIAEQLRDAYEGEPWFGRSISSILNEIDEAIVFKKTADQHSILELLWHMITWKEFTLSRLRNDDELPIKYFEENDWRMLDHSDKALWQQGLQEFSKLHNELVEIIRQQNDELLFQRVRDRKYDFRKLLYGIVQHDIYHLGQIAYIKKMLTRQQSE